MRAREKILAGFAGLAFAFGGVVGTQTAEAASANAELHRIVSDGQADTGEDAVKISFQDSTWSLIVEDLTQPDTNVTAYFRIDKVGYSRQDELQPADSISGSQTFTDNADFGIFGWLRGTSTGEDEDGVIGLGGVEVHVRTIDSQPAPQFEQDGPSAFENAGDHALTFVDRPQDGDFYRIWVDPNPDNDRFNFEFGLSLEEQLNLPPIVLGTLRGATEHHVFGQGWIGLDDASITTVEGQDFRDGRANFSAFMIPTPAAALPGLAMLGLLAFRRPMRRRDA